MIQFYQTFHYKWNWKVWRRKQGTLPVTHTSYLKRQIGNRIGSALKEQLLLLKYNISNSQHIFKQFKILLMFHFLALKWRTKARMNAALISLLNFHIFALNLIIEFLSVFNIAKELYTRTYILTYMYIHVIPLCCIILFKSLVGETIH